MRSERGFSLIEVIVATGVLVVALVSLSEVFGMAIRSNIASRATTHATILAQQKLEELRGLTWGFDTEGLPVSDIGTDTTIVPTQANGGTGLSASPPTALVQNAAGFVDHIDQFGRKLGRGADPPVGAVYTRRWAIEPLPGNPDTLVIQVRVVRAGTGHSDNRLPEEARIVTLKTRKPL
jgi:prepilin-type N-terminal cleavage/methylation domain-containing protein